DPPPPPFPTRRSSDLAHPLQPLLCLRPLRRDESKLSVVLPVVSCVLERGGQLFASPGDRRSKIVAALFLRQQLPWHSFEPIDCADRKSTRLNSSHVAI